MSALNSKSRRPYTFEEEVWSCAIHGLGIVLSIAGLTTLVALAARYRDVWTVVSTAVFGVSMIVLYTASTIYHAVPNLDLKRHLKKFDHISIYYLIAGSYTPFLLVCMRGTLGWTIFGIVWGVSALGITLNAIDLKKYNVFSVICYIALGWYIVFTGKTAVDAIGLKGFLWLLAGGISYTVGAVLYGIAGHSVHRYMHSVFHIFVVIGSILQYFCVIFYILV